MRKLIVCTVALTALAVPATASADRAQCSKSLETSYSKLYSKVAHKHGKRAPGRNIRKNGVLFKRVTFDATCGELRRSRSQLKKLLRPAPPRPAMLATVAVAPAQPPAGVESPQTVTTGAGGSSNAYVNPNCESGGNPQVYDPSGTYWGKYQFDRSTWAANGGNPASYGSASEAEQDRVAAQVTYDAWPNC